MTATRFQVSPPLSAAVRTRRQLTTRALGLLESHGYAEIEIPLLAPYDELRAALGPEVSARLFRFIDRDGTMLVLRGDLTPVVARQLASVVAAHPSPLRVAYATRVARIRRAFAREQVEGYELGAELVGSAGPEAEREVIGRTMALLADLGAPDPELVLGDVRISEGLVAATGLSGPARAALVEAVRLRDPAAVRAAAAGTTADLRDALVRVCALTPSLDDLSVLEAGGPEQTRIGAAALRALFATLESDLGAGRIALDLGTLDDRGYYTGARFLVRSESAEAPLARGGRYDGLFRHFGPDLPAVGVGFDLDLLVQVSEAAGAR